MWLYGQAGLKNDGQNNKMLIVCSMKLQWKLFTDALQLQVPLEASLTSAGCALRSSTTYLLFHSFYLLFTIEPVWFPTAYGSVQADISGFQCVCQSPLSEPIPTLSSVATPHPQLLPCASSPPSLMPAGTVLARTTVLHLAVFCSPDRSLQRNLQSPEPASFFGSDVGVYFPMDVQNSFSLEVQKHGSLCCSLTLWRAVF